MLVARAHRTSVVSWRACGAFDGLFGEGSQWGEGGDDEGCGGGAFALELGEGETVMLPGAATQALFDNLELAERVLGGALPPDTIDHIRDSVGLPFMIEATVRAGDKLIRAVKRVLISERAVPHHNPPPPAFMLGDLEIVAVGDRDSGPDDKDGGPDRDPESDAGEEGASDAAVDASRPPFACRARDGTAPRLAADSRVELAPILPEGAEAEPWLERYQVIDMRGALQARDEIAFYSWFATAGELREGVTKSPLRNEIWRTPRRSGCYTLWLVVRDGHGGTSACGVDVAIGDALCD